MYKNYRVFYILILFSFLNAEARSGNEVERKYSIIDSLIYKEKDYDEALRFSKDFLKIHDDDFNRAYAYIVKSIINLIENYSDYDRKPLELFFEYMENYFERLKCLGNSAELCKENGIIFREILEKYPDCNLAGFVQYMLGIHYQSQINSTDRYLERREIAIEKAIESYREVIRKYPTVEMPIYESWRRFKIGLKIAPIALLKIGDLYYFDYRVKKEEKDPVKAIETYESVINNYPEDVDFRGNKVAINAYVSILNIYRKNKNSSTFLDTVKAKEICNILINKFPNQGYDYKGGHIGETHPEAYMFLADFETDKEKAIKIYEKIMTEFPNNWTGRGGSGAVGRYGDIALGRIKYLFKDPESTINYYRKILNSALDINIRGSAQYSIASIYEEDIKDYNQALVEYQKVLENFADVNPSGEYYPLGEGAKSRISVIQEKLNEEQKKEIKSP